ncbi:PilZ domain-containing protein [Texcoconibacillus texcoconensis]|uniref:PilZ domain-containing protein n=1 Tax=Texcoconibacillus texcoconensis TaxID=1095777 RepID=A0A840QMF1_9BACI|nr:PilZ domain-containing protein [Texcoconibacillus texcoconensis]MBB5172510.1 hypothetical protein [Texcoconibacillus texcoconensis]
MTEKRNYFRIPLNHPLDATMTILKIKGEYVDLGKTKILIEDIGLGGIRFISTLKLPVLHDVILYFETEILGRTISPVGHIVWKHDIDDELSQYGVEFTIEETHRDEIAHTLNQFAVKLRNRLGSVPPNTRFVYEDRKTYLMKLNV